MNCLRVAKEKGITVSFDGNFRSKLWTWEEAREFCTQCLPYVDVLMGIEPYHLWKDESDHSKGDVKDGVPMQLSYEQQDEIFPCICRTLSQYQMHWKTCALCTQRHREQPKSIFVV